MSRLQDLAALFGETSLLSMVLRSLRTSHHSRQQTAQTSDRDGPLYWQGTSTSSICSLPVSTA